MKLSTRLLVCCMPLFLILALASCSGKFNYTQAEKRNTNKFSDEGLVDEALFLMELKSFDLMIKDMAEFIKENGYASIIRDYVTEVKNDHLLFGTELGVMAKRKGIFLPNSMNKDHWFLYNELRHKKTVQLDQTYVNMMIDELENTIGKFELMIDQSKDNDIRAFAAKKVELFQKSYKKTLALKNDLAEVSG